MEFGDFAVLRGNSKDPHLHCPEDGVYRLRASVRANQRAVKSASRKMYVQQEPPPPPVKKPITTSISVVNPAASERKRVNSGETFRIEATARNRMPHDRDVEITASVVLRAVPGNYVAGVDVPQSVMLARGRRVRLPGTRIGETPVPTKLVGETFTLFDDMPQSGLSMDRLVAAPGVHHVRIDVVDAESGERLAWSSAQVYFEQDPPGTGGKLPFVLKRKEGGDGDKPTAADPMWWIDKPSTASEPMTLFYSPDHHLYQTAQLADRGRKPRGTTAFIREICADALIDWMLEPYSSGDDSRFEPLRRHRDASKEWEFVANGVFEFLGKVDNDATLSEQMEYRRRLMSNMIQVLNGDAN